MNRSIKNSARGFSLIEVLVALAIMGVSLAALYQSAMGATKNAHVSAEYTVALALAESTMEEFLAVGAPSAGMQGDFGGFYWSAVSVPLEENPGQPGDVETVKLAEVQVVVVWGGRGQDREIRLQTIAPVGVANVQT